MSPCVIWTGAKNNNGYGVRTVSGSYWLAHRYAYTLEHGSIPDGMVIDHLCNTPACVNPEHLEVVTQVENMRRYSERLLRCKRGGHEFTPENTLWQKQSNGRGGYGRVCRICKNERQRNRKKAK